MTTAQRIRASDADREQIAARIQQASAEGRFTLDETEQRLGEIYAAKYLDELTGFVADLPPEPVPRQRLRFPPPLRVHAAIVVALSVLLITRWIASGVPFFWPIVPMFWLGASLVAHVAIRARRTAVP